MKSVSIRDLQRQVKEVVDASQKDRVLVTRHGRPAAIILGVEGQDWDQVVLETDPKFWRMIRKRRGQATISIREMRKRVLEE